MQLKRLVFTQELPVDLGQAWEFFSDPRNLTAITPPDLGFRIECDLPPRMHPGLLIEYTISPFPPLRARWITEITHTDEPHYFVDEQRFGPYRFWHHQHIFTKTATGTEMTDRVSYLLPFGPVGSLAAPLVAARLAVIFNYRRRILEEMNWGQNR